MVNIEVYKFQSLTYHSVKASVRRTFAHSTQATTSALGLYFFKLWRATFSPEPDYLLAEDTTVNHWGRVLVMALALVPLSKIKYTERQANTRMLPRSSSRVTFCNREEACWKNCSTAAAGISSVQ